MKKEKKELTHLPIYYLLFLAAYSQNHFTLALKYLTESMSQLEVNDNAYFIEMKKHILWRIGNSDGIYSERMNKTLSAENNFKELNLPACPYCDKCKISSFCMSRSNANFQTEYINKLKQII